jgi:hypothetical protein
MRIDPLALHTIEHVVIDGIELPFLSAGQTQNRAGSNTGNSTRDLSIGECGLRVR